MAAKKSDLKVDEEFRKLCPALGKESRQELELSFPIIGRPHPSGHGANGLWMDLKSTNCVFAESSPIR